MLVGHPEDAQGTAEDVAAGEGRLAEQHQRIERIAVPPERGDHEAVIRGVTGYREELAVESDRIHHRIPLELVATSLRNLDDDIDLEECCHQSLPGEPHRRVETGRL
ncbi:MAG: hypothetical protein JF887_09970 [Candidatus Dormibacteraeota bacterium]|uniref:Uncharacterized protein n=1 Tax=Candidatus Amunia macphersoniae TaxID=3127014 RepID=A0A934KPZ7_9BACT|nr:hypothetical protein [Candidatus Dormibacteraeota bacterium]